MEKDTFYDKLWYWWHYSILGRFIPYIILHPISSFKEWRWVKEFPPGTLVEDCSYKPCVIVENNKGDLLVSHLIGGGFGSCSLFHCGIIKLSREECNKRVDIYNEEGREGYQNYLKEIYE